MTQVPIDIVISSRKAEEGERKVTRSLDNIRDKANQAKSANQGLDKSFRGVGSGIAAIDGPLGGIASRFTAIRTLVQSTGFAIAGFTVGLAGAGFAMRASVRDAVQFSTAMAEVNTLVGDDFAFGQLTRNIREVSKEFGQLPTAQAKAAYQIISAGASSAAEATNTLTAANKLAIGGVTDVATAADGLTTIMNAYGNRVASATSVSDALFVAMRAGKTTIAELSTSIGKVAPLAAQTNTSLEELLASVAALTKGGISTNEAMTGMRAVLAAVAKPTKEASELAGQLGINFTAAGLEAQGFAGFIQEIADKTGGSTAQLSQLFGGVEALVPVLALTGAAGEDFKQILEDMGVSAGETEIAFAKMADNPQFKFDKLKAKFVDLSISIGDALLQVIVPTTQLLIDNFDDLLTVGEALAVIIGVRLATALTISTAAFVKNTIAATANFVAMSRLAGAVGGVSTAQVVMASTAGIATKGLALLAGPLAAGAAIGAYFFLKGRVDSATEAFNSFLATITVIGGAFLKLANYATVPARAIVESFTKAFSQTQKLFDAFILDVRDFFENPFSNNGLARTSEALGNLFSFGAAESIQSAIKDVQTFNKAIDESIDRQLVEWGKENRKAAEENDAFGQTTEDTTAKLQELIDKLNSGNGSGVVDALGKTTEKTNEAKEAVKEFSEETQKLSTIIERAGERIFDTFADTIEDFLKGDIGSWKDYGNKIVDIFRSTFSNIAALALAKPIIVPIIGAAAGAIGLGTDATNQLGQSFGVENLSNLSNLTNLGSGLFDPLLSSGGAVGNTIDQVGNFFGVGGLEAQGPTLSGAAGYQGGVSNLVNPANILASFAGSKLADVFGLSGKYSGIGSTIGSIGGSIGGASVGASMGTILGFAGGPAGALIGTLLGSFGGSALGGLFGGKPSDKGQYAASDLTGAIVDEGGLSGKKFSQENRDAAKSFSQLGASITTLFEEITGEVASFNQIQVKVGNRDGAYVNTGTDGNFDFDNRISTSSSGAAITEALVDIISGSFKELPARLSGVIENIDFTNVEQGLADLDFIGQFEAMFKETEKPLTQVEAALETINISFDDMRLTAERLGYSLEDLNRLEDKRNEAIDNTRKTLYQASASDFLDVAAPGVNQFRSLFDNYNAQMKEFNSVGLDTTFIDRTFQVQQEKLLQQIIRDTYSERITAIEAEADEAQRLVDSYGDISKSLGDAILNLRISEISPITTEERLAEARSTFISTANRAAGGDLDAMGELEGLGNQFLNISRDYYASTDQFVQDFQLVEKALQDSKDKADQQLSVQQQLVDLAQQEIEAINSMATELSNSLQEQQRVTSVINSALQVGKSNANETLVQGYRSGLISEEQLINQISPIFDQLGAPQGDGVGGRSLFFESNPAANAAFIQAMRALGIPGFNYGGNVRANSMFMVGEKRPEIFQAGSSGGKVIPIQNGAEVEQRLINLETEMRASVKIQQEGYKRLETALFRQIEATEENTQAVKRAQ